MESLEAIRKTGEMEAKSLLHDLKFKQFDSKSIFGSTQPLVYRIFGSFWQAAGVGALQALSQEAYSSAAGALRSESLPKSSKLDGNAKSQLPTYSGESGWKSLECVVKRTGRESMEWGIAAGTYSGVTYGLEEMRGVHDWKNAVVAGALAGTALALARDQSSCDLIVESAIKGAAVSSVAAMLNNVF